MTAISGATGAIVRTICPVLDNLKEYDGSQYDIID
jgi:hypothetical protein